MLYINIFLLKYNLVFINIYNYDKIQYIEIASTGGHLNELMQLKPMFKKYDYHIITEYTKTTNNLKDEYKDRVDYLVFGSKDHIFSYIFKFTYNIFKSIVLYFKIKPDVIITTGTHTSVPMCYIAKIFRKKIIFIETFANINTPTLAGRMIYPIANMFLVQWEDLLKVYPKAIYKGGIY